MKLTVTLTKAQHEALQEHAKGSDLGEDLVRTWWGRTQALRDYAGKLRGGDAEFRAYAPRGLPEEERERLKAMAEAKGLTPARKTKEPRRPINGWKSRRTKPVPAPPEQITAIKHAAKVTQRAHKIVDYDSPGVAFAKAKGDAKVLKEAGRDKTGRRIK
jgi:hypothetical protein